MQCLKRCVQQLVPHNAFNANSKNCLSDILRPAYIIPSANIHGSSILSMDKPTKFLDYNNVIFPPQQPGEERRPGYVCHMKANIKYSPLKMWYIACFVRGMTIDEAIKQLSFLKKRGSAIAKEVILEAQRMAVEEHNIEFKSNLWIAESFSTKGIVIKGLRRHARGRAGEIRYKYCHYFVRLEEGKPPKDYYLNAPKSGEEMLDDWMKKMRYRKIHNSL